MPVLTTGFTDVTFASEHRSIQRYLASLATFTNIEIRRRYEDGVTGGSYGRPYMLITLAQPNAEARNGYWALSRPEFSAAFYSDTYDKALAVVEEFEKLEWKNNRIPLYDYSVPATPVLVTDHKLRIAQVDTNLVEDLDEDDNYNVFATIICEGSRSLDKYSGQQISSVTITNPAD